MSTALVGGAWMVEGTEAESQEEAPGAFVSADLSKWTPTPDRDFRLPDLQPARWIWYP